MTLRLGLFGCGRVVRTHHGPILSTLGGVRVTAVIDPSAEARRDFSRILPGATYFADPARALALDLFDAAIVCTPPATHAAVARAALEAGCHVYVEKPLATGVAEARALIAARDAAGKVAMVGHNFRFHPWYRSARDDLAAGRFGALRGIRAILTSERRTLPGWKSMPGQGGGALEDLGTHHLDLAAFLSGSAVVPGSVAVNEETGPQGSLATVTGHLATDVPFSLTVGQTTGLSTHRVELLCEEGHVTIDLAGRQPPMLERPVSRLGTGQRLGSRVRMLRDALDIRSPRDRSFAAALGHFVKAVRDGVPVEAPLEAGLHTVSIIAAARGPLEEVYDAAS